MGKKTINYEKRLQQSRSKIKKQKPIIVIDIGASQLKVVQMKANMEVKAWGTVAIPEGFISQGRIEAQGPLADLIKKALSKHRIKGNKCALCISGNEVIVRELVLPEMAPEQILENINYEIISFLPLKHADYSIDYKILEYIKAEDDKPDRIRLMVAAIPKVMVNQYIGALKKAGIKVVYVDVVQNSLTKISKLISYENNTMSAAENICIIDIGARTCEVVILSDGEYFTHKTIIKGSNDVTKLISEKNEIDYDRADELKKRENYFNQENEVTKYFENLFSDIDRTISYFKNRKHGQEINKIYITGGGSLQPGLIEFCNKRLSTKTEFLADQLKNYKNQKSKDSFAIFSQAIGVTIREDI
ncbi:MAG TPA: type IV pilus assembly protein PilM [Clostridiales bacterium]|nr:type IV pilus assembly protein PilM [Clostridiales bacterium]